MQSGRTTFVLHFSQDCLIHGNLALLPAPSRNKGPASSALFPAHCRVSELHSRDQRFSSPGRRLKITTEGSPQQFQELIGEKTRETVQVSTRKLRLLRKHNLLNAKSLPATNFTGAKASGLFQLGKGFCMCHILQVQFAQLHTSEPLLGKVLPFLVPTKATHSVPGPSTCLPT